MPGYDDDVPAGSELTKARETAGKALSIDSTLAEAHAAVGYADYVAGEWIAAEQKLQKALALEPGYATGHTWYCLFLTSVGRPEDGLRECDRAIALDSLSTNANMIRGIALRDLRRYDEASAQLLHTLEIDPEFAMARGHLVLVNAVSGRTDRAVDEAERLLALPGKRSGYELADIGYAFARAGRADRAREVIGRFGRAKSGEFVSPLDPAIVYMGLGDRERALGLLEDMARRRAFNVLGTLRSTAFDPIRQDPRFVQVMRAMGLDPVTAK